MRVGWEKCLGGIHRDYKCLEEGEGRGERGGVSGFKGGLGCVVRVRKDRL